VVCLTITMPPIPPTIHLPDTPEARPHDLAEALGDFNLRLQRGDLARGGPTPLGFPQLDVCLGGGLRREDLMLVGGPQNVGKTVFLLQAARHQAATGVALPIVVCYEHSVQALLLRLLCLESVADLDEPAPRGVTLAEIERLVLEDEGRCPNGARPGLQLEQLLSWLPGLEPAWYRLREYLWRLWLVQGDGVETTDFRLNEYVRLARAEGFARVVLYVDYAQRVPLRAVVGQGPLSDSERIDRVLRGLKSLALRQQAPVVAASAADAAGLRRGRVHLEDLWGPATVQYEPDVAVLLNRESFDAEDGVRRVRLSVEKNRHGPSEVEFRHRLHGPFFCLSRAGQVVAARESFQGERLKVRGGGRTQSLTVE
jgi:RecA/RadA recombinase